MKLGVMSALFGGMSLDDALAYCKRVGLQAIELPAGAYPGDPWKLRGIHDDKDRLAELKEKIAAAGLEVCGIAVHGNPVHPDPAIADDHAAIHRDGVRLAAEFNKVVINFSGCPGGAPGDKVPNFVTCPWPPEFEKASKYQWDDVVIPFWAEENDFAAQYGVKIAFEAHPGMVVHSPTDILRLRDAAGRQLGANLDPSHFFWQGIDPVMAARILGEAGCIFHVHAKDCAIDSFNSSVVGKLRQEGKICILATNQEKHAAEFMRKEMGFEKIFDFVVASSDVGHKKPQPEFFEKVFEKIPGIKKDEILFFDDRPENIEAAKKIGLQAKLYKNISDLKECL